MFTSSDSTNDPDSDADAEDDSDTGSDDHDTEDEVWTDVPEMLLQQDILYAPPLPDPVPKQKSYILSTQLSVGCFTLF